MQRLAVDGLAGVLLGLGRRATLDGVISTRQLFLGASDVRDGLRIQLAAGVSTPSGGILR